MILELDNRIVTASEHLEIRDIAEAYNKQQKYRIIIYTENYCYHTNAPVILYA